MPRLSLRPIGLTSEHSKRAYAKALTDSFKWGKRMEKYPGEQARNRISLTLR